MSRHAVSPAAPTELRVAGSDLLFPVRRVYCVGRNYAAHAREMGEDTREPPFFFTKPADAVVQAETVPYPSATADLHHEVELVIALGAGGADLEQAAARAAIWGWAVGVDLTRRDLQNEAKKAQRPWDASKGFDFSGPIGPITPAERLPEPKGRITIAVNGQTRQSADMADMIWSPVEVVAEASRLWTLAPGDLIFTGTPEGVAALSRGDRIEATVEGLEPLRFVLS
jgi:fumarylpyruvate hydrolase